MGCVVGSVHAQDSVFARHLLDTLTSKYFWGRGYTNNGLQKATEFLSGQLKGFGVQPMDGKNYQQQFSYPINTFPGKMEVSVNGQSLTPGRDFIVSPESKGIRSQGRLVQRDSVTFVDTVNRIVVVLENKLTWSAEQKVVDYTVIELDKKAMKSLPTTIKANIENQFIDNFKTANICGIVKGTEKPDSVIVFTAHYDHLGGMGDKTYFPGANDNASGVITVLNLARYYAAHPQRYSIAFILFSGEEAGLVGSQYFTEHPVFPLCNIRFLINLDLEGTGVDGITVVNATVYPKEFELLKRINAQFNYLPGINSRGKAANSDHYPFTEKGVPAFFWYTQGGIAAYHDIYDVAATLPMNKFKPMFNMIVQFVNALQGLHAH